MVVVDMPGDGSYPSTDRTYIYLGLQNGDFSRRFIIGLYLLTIQLGLTSKPRILQLVEDRQVHLLEQELSSVEVFAAMSQLMDSAQSQKLHFIERTSC